MERKLKSRCAMRAFDASIEDSLRIVNVLIQIFWLCDRIVSHEDVAWQANGDGDWNATTIKCIFFFMISSFHRIVDFWGDCPSSSCPSVPIVLSSVRVHRVMPDLLFSARFLACELPRRSRSRHPVLFVVPPKVPPICLTPVHNNTGGNLPRTAAQPRPLRYYATFGTQRASCACSVLLPCLLQPHNLGGTVTMSSMPEVCA